MSDVTALLERHRPVLRYDSHEVYFADSAAIWTDTVGHTLRRGPSGAVLAGAEGAPPLSLSFLGPREYADGTAVEGEDLISRTGRDYAETARRLHSESRYANRVYGRAVVSPVDRRRWLQYWLFFFYNDFELLGDALRAGLHEGDWEMVQLRLDDVGETPDLALYTQHKSAGARGWYDVEKAGERPVVYVARGSHACYFDARTRWSGLLYDHADGEGFTVEPALEVAAEDDGAYAWMAWRGFWGDTKPRSDGLLRRAESNSPRGPGGHGWWRDPHELLLRVDRRERFEVPLLGGPAVPEHVAPERESPKAPLPEPPAPSFTPRRSSSGALWIDYAAAEWPAELEPVQLIVTINSPDEARAPAVRRVGVPAPRGSVEVPFAIEPGRRYEVTVSLA
ncbi:MAG TPA: hypothetical protein VH025_07710, partial [Solirubrobacteraceae bacterium]|nr:hypothetical protein [Solirubrobacteraceae bacterium]